MTNGFYFHPLEWSHFMAWLEKKIVEWFESHFILAGSDSKNRSTQKMKPKQKPPDEKSDRTSIWWKPFAMRHTRLLLEMWIVPLLPFWFPPKSLHLQRPILPCRIKPHPAAYRPLPEAIHCCRQEVKLVHRKNINWILIERPPQIRSPLPIVKPLHTRSWFSPKSHSVC